MNHSATPPGDDAEARFGEHPGFYNYPPPGLGSPASGPAPAPAATGPEATGPEATEPSRLPRKITVTRVAAMRSRQLTMQGVDAFRRAATADGADKSGLTALTYATIANFAADAALAVALANTLFFSATTGESRGMVALYLLVTIAPFAVIAPLIGPALDRLQRGRRLALALSFVLRGVLVLVLIGSYDTATGSFIPWLLYPAALGMLVLSKSFGVLKAAVTPRVLPPGIDLVRTNSRLTVFGLVVGTITVGALAAIAEMVFSAISGWPGALLLLLLITAAGAWLSIRIPAWVEVTEGEVPASITYREHPRPGSLSSWRARITGGRRQPLGRLVIVGLWGTCTIRLVTGFLTLFVAFVAKSRTEHEPAMQVAMLAVIGIAAGLGNFGGNAVGARIRLARPATVVVRCTIVVAAMVVVVAVTNAFAVVALLAAVLAASSALAKVSLDALIQDDVPDASRASAFGRSETALQLSWVFGGALGILMPTELWIGFTAVGVCVAAGLAQAILTQRGRSLVPGLGGHRPEHTGDEPTQP
ncbi:MFS transporter [Lolliginicoccus suaedae]|uniref:MFS transporter n=1 Tax=Lolliginicoccus suaedae TaxID=2605429 RepID=UPI001F3B66AA|nr:MFS transporter [Lolliginicoccus suaedae]